MGTAVGTFHAPLKLSTGDGQDIYNNMNCYMYTIQLATLMAPKQDSLIDTQSSSPTNASGAKEKNVRSSAGILFRMLT